MPSYKRNFLSNVIFRIDYSPILELEKEKPASFQQIIQNDFPILEPLNRSGFMVEKRPDTDPKMESLNKIIWKFLSKNKTKIVELDTNYLAISFINESYTKYEDFEKCIKDVTDNFYKIYPDVIIQKFGLRYINQIKIEEDKVFEWDKYINSNLINNLNFIKEKDNLTRSLGFFILKIGDFNVNFNYGIFNSAFPGKIVDKEFLLDYDCHTSEQIDRDKIIENLNFCNENISKIFEDSIKEDFRKILDII